MVRHGKTKFQEQWLLEPELKLWVKKSPGDVYTATCTFCLGSVISVATMGRQALISHSKSKKHTANVSAKLKQPTIISFRPTQQLPETPETTKSVTTSLSTSSNICCGNEVIMNKPGPDLQSTSHCESNTLRLSVKGSFFKDKFLINKEVTRAEVLWCLHSVHSHKSNRGAAKDISILKYIFSENDILQKMSLERTKIGYIISFGLAPLYKSQLISEVISNENFVISFDESLNKISQSQQMDLVVRFWDNSRNEVCTRYLTSVFLKSATAADLMAAFLAATDCFDLKKLIQISMDGPNVNKKFLSDLQEHFSDELKFGSKMMELGSCGLHTLHCAFKAAISTTNWNLIPYLRAVYNFFKDHPARRGMFTQFTGSTTFPKKFCSVRWLENGDVAENALEMLPSIKTYVEKLQKNKKKIETKSFKIIEESLKDPLLGAKLAFFKTISNDVQPLLQEYQSNSPLASFLYTSLRELIVKEMERFIMSEKISVSLKVLKINENFIPVRNVDVGIGAKCEIGKCKDIITMAQVTNFKNECKEALKCLVERLIEKSPLNYEATRFLTSLDPTISYTNLGKERFEKLVILMTRNNLISSQIAELAQRQFKTVCAQSHDQMKRYKRVEKSSDGKALIKRLDHFWLQLLAENNMQESALEKILKKLLILSHGNAQVERGFSINKDCLVENMKEESLVSIRTVHDAVEYYGGVEKVPVDQKTIQAARSAYGKYKDALENQKKKNKEESEKKANKRINQLLVRELEKKRQKLMAEARMEAEDIDKKISSLINL